MRSKLFVYSCCKRQKFVEKRSDLSMKKERWTLGRHMLLLAAVLIYYEVVFRLSTVGGLFNGATVYMLLFSAVYGCVSALLLTLLPPQSSLR